MAATSARVEDNSVTVVIPAAAGRRDPKTGAALPPTWCLERPDGRLVIESVVRRLGLRQCSRVAVVVLESHVDAYCGGDVAALEAFLIKSIGAAVLGSCRLVVLALKEPTSSAADTVRVAIERLNITGPLFVKDCDGAFAYDVTADNCVVTLRVTSENAASLHDLPSKSFAEECGGVLTNVVEKHIVNDLVCVGGYGFASVADFSRALRAVEDSAARTAKAGGAAGRIFTSHLVLFLLMEGSVVFRVDRVNDFDDWKTAEAWRTNARQHRNIVITLEGVLVRPKTTALAARIREAALTATPLVHSAPPPDAEPSPASSFAAAAVATTATTTTVDDDDEGPSPRTASLIAEFEPIDANIDALRRAAVSSSSAGGGQNKTQVVILSSRPEKARPAVIALLKALAIPCDALVLGSQVATTTIVTAHDALMLPHPAATAFSVAHGTETLADLLL